MPTLLSISSKYVISTLDHCNCWSFVITTGVKVGRIPTISGSSVQQKLIAVGKARCILQPIHQSLPLTGRENHWILERLNYSYRDWICWWRWFQLVYHSFDLIKFGLCQQFSANDLVIRDDKLPRAQIIQDVTEVGSVSINKVRSILTRFCFKSAWKHGVQHGTCDREQKHISLRNQLMSNTCLYTV